MYKSFSELNTIIQHTHNQYIEKDVCIDLLEVAFLFTTDFLNLRVGNYRQ